MEDYEEAEEDIGLRKEINDMIKKKELRRKSQLKLLDFVRVDLLAEETFESAEKEQRKWEKKKKVLKRISDLLPKKKIDARRTSLQFNIEDLPIE